MNLLKKCLEAKSVWIEDGTYVMRDEKDGEIVQIGTVGLDEKSAEKYLRSLFRLSADC